MSLYPLKFKPLYQPKVWGGTQLAKLFNRDIPTVDANGNPIQHPIGEAWEIADLDTTSASGAGGSSAMSVVTNGPLAGTTLRQLIKDHKPQLMGTLTTDEEGHFPLLIKFLDAEQNLSVQVHPDETYAQQHPDAHLKSEAWYIVHAEPDAVIYKGIKEGVTEQQFRQAIEEANVKPLLIQVPVQEGDCHYIPSGTCHALGTGIVVAEVQTPSDTTFRVYDWGRTDRELHIEPAMACMTFGPADTTRYKPKTRIERDHSLVECLVKCEYFIIERYTLDAGYTQNIPHAPGPRIRIILDGDGQITCDNDQYNTTPYTKGETLLLPAQLNNAQTHVTSKTQFLEVSFPQSTETLLA